jgi:glycosyltransferase involved in cell wall biosynthesis
MFVTNTGEYGGAEKHLVQLLHTFADSRIELLILCLSEDLYTEHLGRTENLRVDVIHCKTKPDSFLDWYRLFREYRPDVAVFVRAWLWCYRWYVPIAAWIAGVPRRISIAHLEPPVPAPIEGKSMQRLALRARRIFHLWSIKVSTYFEQSTICVSNAIRDALLEGYRYPSSSTVTIHNGVQLRDSRVPDGERLAVRHRLGLSEQEFVLVCIARLSEQKRIDILLLAMAHLIRGGFGCKCIIVGDGPLRASLAERSVSLGLNGYVFFEGFQEDTVQYLLAGTAFVLTSDREGLPLALLEAMASGLPCIVTTVGGNVEAITDRVSGLLVRPDSPSDIAEAIKFLILHPNERLEMAKKAQERARKDFDIEKSLADLRAVILG